MIYNQLTQTILKDEICPECYSDRLFKCLEQRKCLDCNHEFESIKYVTCSEEELFYKEGK